MKQQGNGHEWRDLTEAEAKAVNGPKENPEASWCKTRVCGRCGMHAADFLDPDQLSCDKMVVELIHGS